MSAHVTIHTGFMGSEDLVEVDWFDHDNITYKDRIEIKVEPYDKPRTLTVSINGRIVWQRSNRGEIYP